MEEAIEKDRAEETLDPQDWEAMRRLAHRMVDDTFDFLRDVRQRPAWQPIPEAVKGRLRQPLPATPQDPEQVYEDFLQNVRPYPRGSLHPRFWGWVEGTGTPLAAMADMLASALNSNASFGEQSPVYVEMQVVEWLKELLGYPRQASGLLVSGGSMANLVGLTVARNARAGFDVARQGLSASPARLVLYGSREMHNSIQKAVELLGLGDDALRRIPVDAQYRIDIAALEEAIAEDRARGLRPFCVVGNAGTVNTGATDDLNRLADLCEREVLWFHVDGAFGAFAAIEPSLKDVVAGLARADSLAFDLHKWMYMPYEAGCALVRHAEAHKQTFSPAGSYLSPMERGVASGGLRFSDHGVQLSRGFRALKVWMSIKEHGADKFRRMVRQNVEQAAYLARLIEAAPELELLAPAPLNIVCFRFRADGLDEEALNELNREVLMRLHERGVAVPSYTTLEGRFAIRVAITNHRSRREDFDALVEAVVRFGNELLDSRRGNEGTN